MNNIIKQLIKEADLENDLCSIDDNWDYPELEEFARLIVSECITLVNKIPVRVEPISGQNFKYIQLATTIDTIKDHFGVEE